jgi:hypothetical protein
MESYQCNKDSPASSSAGDPDQPSVDLPPLPGFVLRIILDLEENGIMPIGQHQLATVAR